MVGRRVFFNICALVVGEAVTYILFSFFHYSYCNSFYFLSKGVSRKSNGGTEGLFINLHSSRRRSRDLYTLFFFHYSYCNSFYFLSKGVSRKTNGGTEGLLPKLIMLVHYSYCNSFYFLSKGVSRKYNGGTEGLFLFFNY